jgi:hypothetical protein
VSDYHSLETLTEEDFRVHVGSGFWLSAGSESGEGGSAVSVELELAEVSEPAFGASGPARAPFSLLLRGTGQFLSDPTRNVELPE